MSFWAPAPAAPSKLRLYRKLSPLAGIHVSPLVLGAMSIGDSTWAKESSFKLLDAYFDKGGNFIDTANNYQDETSEKIIGEWAETRGIRDQLVIATKYTSNFKRGNGSFAQIVNYTGNNTKSMSVSVDASLKKLRTAYIDILYVHWWDWGIEELMHSPGQGLGISDTPAWVVSQANQYAKDHGKTPFVIYEGQWNVLDRSFERDIIPMCRLAIAPWGVLGGGKFRIVAEEDTEERRKTGEKGRTTFNPQWERNENEKKISYTLEKVAGQVRTKSLTATNHHPVAIAYVIAKVPYCFPIIGGRKIEHVTQIAYLESIVPFEPGFPAAMIGDGTKSSAMLGMSALFASQSVAQPISLAKKR
ncbi:Aldo/keto reductase [Favolaschia claudopus]|uniref:Aldo/keto reductase n=1 Tax=Favolaschia claudopus TaxID=2862362 RepID=A0AAW0BKQ4_9AGAR